MQISLQFDEFFLTKYFKILILRTFESFTKTSHLKLDVLCSLVNLLGLKPLFGHCGFVPDTNLVNSANCDDGNALLLAEHGYSRQDDGE